MENKSGKIAFDLNIYSEKIFAQIVFDHLKQCVVFANTVGAHLQRNRQHAQAHVNHRVGVLFVQRTAQRDKKTQQFTNAWQTVWKQHRRRMWICTK